VITQMWRIRMTRQNDGSDNVKEIESTLCVVSLFHGQLAAFSNWQLQSVVPNE
jgi:hypothetical protein